MKTQKFNIIHALAIRLSSIKNTSKTAVRCAVWAFFIFRNLLKLAAWQISLNEKSSTLSSEAFGCGRTRIRTADPLLVRQML